MIFFISNIKRQLCENALNMNLPLEVSSKVEICLLICYFITKNEDATAIYRNIIKVYGNVLSVEMMGKWCRPFLDVRIDVSDKNEEVDRVKLTPTQSVLFTS